MDKNQVYAVSRAILVVLWLSIAFAFLVPTGGPAVRILRGTGGLLAVAHFTEYALFYRRIRALPEGPFIQFTMNFFFGLFYWSRPKAGGDEP